METLYQIELVGEVHCLNCGRILAEAVRHPSGGKMHLRPAGHQEQIMVSVVDGRSLRCRRCQGRAYIEPATQPGLSISVPEPDSIRPMVGAA